MLTRPVKLLSNDNLPFSYNKVRASFYSCRLFLRKNTPKAASELYDICSHFDDLKPDWFLEGPDVEKRKARERKQELRRLERVAASKASGEYDRIMSDLKARRNDIDKKDAHENVEKLDSVDDED